MSEVLFGYRTVTGVPLCPCRDPGNYMMLEQVGADPLDGLLRCWCGATMKVRFDDLIDRGGFLAKQGAGLPPAEPDSVK